MTRFPILAAAGMAAAFAQPAHATTIFQGSATVLDLNTSDPGLVLYAAPIAFGPFALEVGEHEFFNVMTIGTNETAVSWFEDTKSFDIEVGFAFDDPSGVSDTTVTGTTRGRFLASEGIVRWDSPVTFTFGDTGTFRLWLFDMDFHVPGEDTVKGKIKLLSEPTPAIPEPATWSLMLVGFGALGFVMRRRASIARFA